MRILESVRHSRAAATALTVIACASAAAPLAGATASFRPTSTRGGSTVPATAAGACRAFTYVTRGRLGAEIITLRFRFQVLERRGLSCAQARALMPRSETAYHQPQNRRLGVFAVGRFHCAEEGVGVNAGAYSWRGICVARQSSLLWRAWFL